MEFYPHWRITQGTILIMGQIFIVGSEVHMINVTEIVSRIKRDEFPFNSF